MGLDMYLYAEKYVGGWDHGDEEERQVFASLTETADLEQLITPDSPSLTVSVTCAYWRKANAIHQWFVANVQNGVDDCGRYYVHAEQLGQLRESATKALLALKSGEPDKAVELLPPQEGFFFGSTNVDGYYTEMLTDTVEQIERVLTNGRGVDFYYHSSW